MPYTAILSSDYSRQSFIDNVLKPIFQNRVLEFTLYDNDIIEQYDLTESEKEVASAVIKYGEMQTSDNKTIELFDVVLRDNVRIERNKIKVGSLVKNKIMTTHALFANFSYETPNDKEWRFSFIAYDSFFEEGDIVTKETNPKRYTYLLGNGNSCRTASNRFDSLTSNSEITLALVKEAFSVENVSKDFFDEYRKHYGDFVQFLTGKRTEKVKGKWTEVKKGKPSPLLASTFGGDEKKARDFCKKTLGRIVFLYFLQKKGWLGASSLQYTDGDSNFLQTFFNQTEKSSSFYPNHLSTLFFDTLNSERSNDNFTMPNGSAVKIPFLNGGLFDLEKEEYRFITFPPELFENLFEFFNRYNFTVYEDSSEDHTVAVDPEMLGHIFENLLEDNKDKGAFYTPRPIVEYMCQESLVQYLLTQGEKEGLIKSEGEKDTLQKSLELFIKNKEIADLKEYETFLATALRNVKICDPAIGSGAFPMGILHEVFTAINVLHEVSPDVVNSIWGIDDPTEWQPAQIKEHIIQNSIYGVDIEKGAVDIARLRFWLSLVVDEDTPRALPNLDYKIMQGNSLLESYHDIDLDVSKLDQPATELFADPNAFTQNDVDRLRLLVEQYFHPEPGVDKNTIRTEIENIVRRFINERVSEYKEIWDKKWKDCTEKLAKASRSVERDKGTKAIKDKALNTLNKELAKIQGKLDEIKKQEADIQTMFREKDYNFFLWHLWFFEVFENGGFDIVIGNPPYINANTLKKKLDTWEFEKLKDLFSCAKGAVDIYILFFELSFSLLKNAGNLAFITPNKFLSAPYGTALREFILEKGNLIAITDYSRVDVFREASVYPIVSLLQKSIKQNQKIKIGKSNKRFDLRWLFNLRENLSFLPDYIWGFLLSDKIDLVKKIIGKSIPISTCGLINATSTAGEADAYHDLINNENGHKLINTGTIDSYMTKWGISELTDKGVRYLTPYIDIKSNIVSENRRNLYENPKIIFAKIALTTEAFLDIDGEYSSINTNCIHTFHADYNPFYIEGFVNSKLYQLQFDCFFDGLRMAGGYLPYSSPNISATYIFQASNEIQKKFETIVKQIHGDKKSNKDTTALEQEIDTMVFKLYELSYDEVLVVEPEYWLSKAEYESFEL